MGDSESAGFRKRLIVLGSTGSIGVNTLSVVKQHSDLFEIAGLSCGSNVEVLSQQIANFRPKSVAIANKEAAERVSQGILSRDDIELYTGSAGVESLVKNTDADILVSGLVGAAGLLPTLAAIRKGMTIALANKETMVIAGELVTKLAKENGIKIIPIDSEHSAIWQCLAGEKWNEIEKLYLTGSGGPFLNRSGESLANVSLEEALAHPRWKMGKKITIDSATLMNKGLEIIEARWLFDVSSDQIEIVIHPESIIHSMVEFVDGSVKAQLGVTDMYLPIQYALSYPQRLPTESYKLDIFKEKTLNFIEPDREKFPSLDMALEALREGGTAPAVLNAANEEAVMLFLQERISFLEIYNLVQKALDKRESVTSQIGLEELLEADTRARDYIHSIIR